MPLDLPPDFELFAANVRHRLLFERNPQGYWVGHLSSSALSTATAVFTLCLHDRELKTREHAELIRGGLQWLAATQNDDGGWGDTTLSRSNISTTALCWAVFAIPEAAGFELHAERAAAWLRADAGSLEPNQLATVIADRYGKDRTFSVPILTMLTLAGRLGPAGWQYVSQLPFELAALPFWVFRWLRLPVVSYALPALIAIGHVRHHHRPTWNPITRVLRAWVSAKTLRKLNEIQPTTGGYLEATPLTSFVAMSLIASGQAKNSVVTEGVRFLTKAVRGDGSWPIDTNLATWVTTLAVNALMPNGPTDDLPADARQTVAKWLLNQQYKTVHPYTQAAPGGWAWTDLPGGVPDADDTPGAMLALAKLAPDDRAAIDAATAGARWLLDVQNADGGIPTFCRGWTGLPFDRSSADLTAHTLLAWNSWRHRFDAELQRRIHAASQRGIDYLKRTQHADGAWAPLWFGNEHAREIANLTYGTSRVLRLARCAGDFDDDWRGCLQRAKAWLLSNQNPDGGWGGRAGTPSSLEETALALEAILIAKPHTPLEEVATKDGFVWLQETTRNGQHFPPAPIGFYFANLWYYETLYPVIDITAALANWD
ncbi:prenyltransferase/squalene oxidase repeat-containing protein [soil metagenome]